MASKVREDKKLRRKKRKENDILIKLILFEKTYHIYNFINIRNIGKKIILFNL